MSYLRNLATPQGLLNAVFFYNRRNVCLRATQGLQIQLASEKVFDVGNELLIVAYEYTEQGSKNSRGVDQSKFG